MARRTLFWQAFSLHNPALPLWRLLLRRHCQGVTLWCGRAATWVEACCLPSEKLGHLLRWRWYCVGSILDVAGASASSPCASRPRSFWASVVVRFRSICVFGSVTSGSIPLAYNLVEKGFETSLLWGNDNFQFDLKSYLILHKLD